MQLAKNYQFFHFQALLQSNKATQHRTAFVSGSNGSTESAFRVICLFEEWVFWWFLDVSKPIFEDFNVENLEVKFLVLKIIDIAFSAQKSQKIR
jgi:hypothetical protein